MILEDAQWLQLRTKVVHDGSVYDFDGVGNGETAFLIPEGSTNHDGRLRVSLADIKLKDLPLLPPKWDWHPSNGRDGVQIKYRALGPQIGRERVVAHGEHQGDDTPEGCARAAWALWEHLSGLERRKGEDVTQAEWTRDWYGTRWEALWALLKEEDSALHRRACDIIANGSEMDKPPTYAQRYNRLKWQRDKLREYIEKNIKECREFAAKDINAYLLCADMAMLDQEFLDEL